MTTKAVIYVLAGKYPDRITLEESEGAARIQWTRPGGRPDMRNVTVNYDRPGWKGMLYTYAAARELGETELAAEIEKKLWP